MKNLIVDVAEMRKDIRSYKNELKKIESSVVEITGILHGLVVTLKERGQDINQQFVHTKQELEDKLSDRSMETMLEGLLQRFELIHNIS
jgi:hypothetical protein